MFKALLSVGTRMSPTREVLARAAESGDAEAGEALAFGANIKQFAFFPALAETMAEVGSNAEALAGSGQFGDLIEYLVDIRGLGYAVLPKGLLHFHRVGDDVRTPFEEQLVEAGAYTRDADSVCRVHFTVSREHLARFETRLDLVRHEYEARLGVRFLVTFSTQASGTDTIAVDLANIPQRDDDGRLLCRPGGHGALLRNLNALDGDVVFVKNIDNVVPDHLKEPTLHWKRVLGGYLMTIQERAHGRLHALHTDPSSEAAVAHALTFLTTSCGVEVPATVETASVSGRREFAIAALDRPIRVCGMVRNQGEPGGGPFWVVGPKGGRSMQIVESAQVDTGSTTQAEILAAATHFNPVDLVCGLRDWCGRPFDLERFVDPNTVFISEKSIGGRRLKALEHPGLWNGAMAGWITRFVEVPPETFNPVKTVNDLLRPQHQPDPS